MIQQKDYYFKHYVAKGSPDSALAIANLQRPCDRYFPSIHKIELVDVSAEPERAHENSIFVTSTLVKCAPEPTIRVVGSLRKTEIVVSALNLSKKHGR